MPPPFECQYRQVISYTDQETPTIVGMRGTASKSTGEEGTGRIALRSLVRTAGNPPFPRRLERACHLASGIGRTFRSLEKRGISWNGSCAPARLNLRSGRRIPTQGQIVKDRLSTAPHFGSTESSLARSLTRTRGSGNVPPGVPVSQSRTDQDDIAFLTQLAPSFCFGSLRRGLTNLVPLVEFSDNHLDLPAFFVPAR